MISFRRFISLTISFSFLVMSYTGIILFLAPKGRVANSEWCPIFPLEDDSLVDEMTTYAKDHLNDGKDIYVICNSGKRGAEKGKCRSEKRQDRTSKEGSVYQGSDGSCGKTEPA